MEDTVQHGASLVEFRYRDLVNQSRIAHAHVERGRGQRKKTGEVSGVLKYSPYSYKVHNTLSPN